MEYEAINHDHHAFEPSLQDRDERGCCMCDHCGCYWNDEKHYNWKGEKIPMKNVSVVIVKEDGTNEKRASEDFEEGEL